MIARGFKSVMWVGAVGSAALGCYMVSLRVATERADLARVEHQIVEAKRDIRSLETELGTRGRLAQLEDWNSNVLALSAPTSSQFVKDGYALAQLQTHAPTVQDRTGDVRMASLETGAAAPEAKPQAVAANPEAAAPKPDAAPAPEARPVAPRIVRAVAPAPHEASLVRRASFDTSVTAEASAEPRAAAVKPARPQPALPTHAAVARTDPAKKVKTADAAAPAKHEPQPLVHSATTDKPKAVKPAAKPVELAAKHAPVAPKPAAKPATRIAGADAAARASASGHRGGAQ